MSTPYEPTDPYDEGMLPVGDGHTIHWSVSGNPDGKPIVLIHGGPGSGASPRHRRMFDPARFRIVQFDQRNCGRSTPYAGEPVVDLSANTTANLIDDIEQLRTMLGIERWALWGGSWGSTLSLAYAEAHPERVTAVMCNAVCATNATDVDWVTRAMGRIMPRAWQEFRDFLPPEKRDGNLPAAYNELLMNPDPAVHQPAAEAWCLWEDNHMGFAGGFEPGLSEADPSFQLCFARLVTHYWANASFLPERHLLDNLHRLVDIPVSLAHGRLDISSPIDFPVAVADELTRLGGTVDLLIADDDGHGGDAMTEWTVAFSDRLADAD